jgi:hypothetical protein
MFLDAGPAFATSPFDLNYFPTSNKSLMGNCELTTYLA